MELWAVYSEGNDQLLDGWAYGILASWRWTTLISICYWGDTVAVAATLLHLWCSLVSVHRSKSEKPYVSATLGQLVPSCSWSADLLATTISKGSTHVIIIRWHLRKKVCSYSQWWWRIGFNNERWIFCSKCQPWYRRWQWCMVSFCTDWRSHTSESLSMCSVMHWWLLGRLLSN